MQIILHFHPRQKFVSAAKYYNKYSTFKISHKCMQSNNCGDIWSDKKSLLIIEILLDYFQAYIQSVHSSWQFMPTMSLIFVYKNRGSVFGSIEWQSPVISYIDSSKHDDDINFTGPRNLSHRLRKPLLERINSFTILESVFNRHR